MKARVHILISGEVQGVFFRSNTRDFANGLGLKGWVRNLTDGRVEVVAEGEKSLLERLIEFCRKGPPGARVENIEIEWEENKDEFEGFDIRY